LMGVVALPCFWQLFALTASFSLLPPSCCQVSFLPASLNFKPISYTYNVCLLSSKNCTAMLCLQSWRSSLYTANPNTSLDSPPHFHFWRFLTFDLHLVNQPSGKHMVMRYGCCCALLIIQLPLNLRS
jgi:hypothetical protein